MTLSEDEGGNKSYTPLDPEARKKVYFLSAHVANNGTKFFLKPEARTHGTKNFVMQTWIDPWSNEQPGSYGVFRPGKQDEFRFEVIGNVLHDSPGIFKMEEEHLLSYREMTITNPVPRISVDPNM